MSSNYQLTGRVIHVGETEEIGAKKFKKRAIVVETDGDSKWPQQVPVEFVGENVEKLDGVMRDAEVEIDFDIRGRVERQVLRQPARLEDPQDRRARGGSPASEGAGAAWICGLRQGRWG